MDIRKLQRIVVDALEDVKGQDIKVFNTSGITGLFDRIVIASGTSNRQTRALAASVRDKVKSAGGDIISVEGEETGEWVLVDLGDAVVHIMQPPIRSYYNLEELWGLKPVSMKTARELAGSPPAKTSAVTGRAAAPAEFSDVDDVDETKIPAKKAKRKTAATRSEGRRVAESATELSREAANDAADEVEETYSSKPAAKPAAKKRAAARPRKSAAKRAPA